MDTTLIATLHSEERMILAQLRDSIPFRRLEEIQKLLNLYAAQPPIGATLDQLLAERDSIRSAQPAPQQTVIALHGERAFA